MAKRGKFIVIEGGEGSGKTTILKFLEQQLFLLGMSTLFTREPGGSFLGTKIRTLLLSDESASSTALTELFLFCADRSQHVSEIIEPALKKGQHVFCDRFNASTEAYQIAGRRQESLYSDFKTLDSIARQGTEPDFVIYLDISVEEGLCRALGRSEKASRFDKIARKFHEKVRERFLRLCENDKQRWAKVDASQSLDVVQSEVLEIVKKQLGIS
jgi:dTMP kinase